jgi:hypothetical protein
MSGAVRDPKLVIKIALLFREVHNLAQVLIDFLRRHALISFLLGNRHKVCGNAGLHDHLVADRVFHKPTRGPFDHQGRDHDRGNQQQADQNQDPRVESQSRESGFHLGTHQGILPALLALASKQSTIEFTPRCKLSASPSLDAIVTPAASSRHFFRVWTCGHEPA